MILLKRGAGDPGRVDHAVAILRPSTLDEIGAALTAYASSGGTTAYVERVGDRYRWSPAVEGGPYPLLCVLARFLGCAHDELTIGFRTVDDRWCVIGDPAAHHDGYVLLDGLDDISRLSATGGWEDVARVVDGTRPRAGDATDPP
jgi:hypothetical protein